MFLQNHISKNMLCSLFITVAFLSCCLLSRALVFQYSSKLQWVAIKYFTLFHTALKLSALFITALRLAESLHSRCRGLMRYINSYSAQIRMRSLLHYIGGQCGTQQYSAVISSTSKCNAEQGLKSGYFCGSAFPYKQLVHLILQQKTAMEMIIKTAVPF